MVKASAPISGASIGGPGGSDIVVQADTPSADPPSRIARRPEDGGECGCEEAGPDTGRIAITKSDVPDKSFVDSAASARLPA
jgi:hypothetical protein